MKIILLLIVVAFIQQAVTAQSSLHGSVAFSNHAPAINASTLLLHAKDTSLVKAIVCDKDGAYHFNNVADGNYLITASFSGYQQVYSNVISLHKNDDTRVSDIILTEQTSLLNEVKVAAKKPFLEQKIDRLVINVANSITSAGNTALEVLERSPGIIVDHQNNTIAMNGKDGVVVMINGKINYMPVSALVQLLNGMSANNIEKIELITTPPANFDAAGNAGYINIVLKENNSYGTNGSYYATLGYSRGPITEAGMNINHRQGSINIYGDISYSRIKGPFEILSVSKISNAGIITETDFTGNRTQVRPNVNSRFGIDWQTSKKTIAGILLSGYANRYAQSENNISNILKNNVADTNIYHQNGEHNNWYNYSGNINLQHNFNETDKLFLNADYIHYYNNQPVNYNSAYYNNDNKFVYNQIFRSGKHTPMNFWVAAADYSKKINKNINLEAGAKQTFSSFDNDISFERLLQNVWMKDDSLSARYKLKEDYSAAYASFDITLNATTEVKAGLRYEHTNSNLGTEDAKNIVDRHYGNFFPSIFISHKIDDNSTVDVSYSRRITRPTFNDLAPFTYYVNANTLLTGNPALQPSLSDNYKFDYTFKQYLFSLSYSNEDNSVQAFQPHADSVTNKVVLTAENLISQKTAAVVIAVPVNITKWWNLQLSITGLWQQSNALYKGGKITLSQSNVNGNANMRFTLPKNFSAEVTGQYQSAQLFGIYRLEPMGSLDIGLKKKLPGRYGAFALTATNILNSNTFKFGVNLPEQNLVNVYTLRFSIPAYKLTYTRNFGKEKLKEKRERSTGAEDEKGRVH